MIPLSPTQIQPGLPAASRASVRAAAFTPSPIRWERAGERVQSTPSPIRWERAGERVLLILFLLCLLLPAPALAGKPPVLQTPWLTEPEPPPFPVPPLIGFWITQLEPGHHYTIEAKDGPGPFLEIHAFTAPLDIGDGALGFWFIRGPGVTFTLFKVRNDGDPLAFLLNPFAL